MTKSVHVVGLGLIGASLCLAFRDAGWLVAGTDIDRGIRDEALRLNMISSTQLDPMVDLVVIATPAGVVVDVARDVLSAIANPTVIVTDVAGVKSDIAAAVHDPRFLAGHPMAGSELRGLQGARPDLFAGCTWILTPTVDTVDDVYSRLHGYLRELNAAVVAVSPRDHDRLVAIASHVPHVLSGTLMNHAAAAAREDAVLLQLAAGGFRDMTRISAGDPTIWPDVLLQNRDAVTQVLGDIERDLAFLRQALGDDDRTAIFEFLTTASVSRRLLPGRTVSSEHLAHLRIPMLDRPGVLATITMVASDLLVNIFDIEIAHGIEGAAGSLMLTIDSGQIDTLVPVLREKGFTVVVEQ